MNKKPGPYHVANLSPGRRLILDFLDLTSWEHYMYGLLEVDVTVPRQIMQEYKARTGEGLSFTGYLIFCLAQAINEEKSVQSYLKGRKQLVIFEDVDVGMMIEHQVGGARIPLGHVIRRANHKTFMEIHREIRAIQAAPAPSIKTAPLMFRLLQPLPGALLRFFLALFRMAKRLDPAGMWVANVGTVGITSVGMFGNGSGWGLAPVEQTLGLIVGGIARKPAIAGDRIEPREILNLTVAFDHKIVDGAPATRFVKRLVELIESGYGLEECISPLDTEAAPISAAKVPG